MRASARLACCALLGLAAVAVGCGSKAPAVTGLTVTITMVGVSADQLELSVTTPDGTALPATRRPLAANGTLTSPQSVSIFLGDALAGQVATCSVTPFSGDQAVGPTASGTATLLLHQLVPLAIELDAGTPDGGGGGAGGSGGGAAGTGGAGGLTDGGAGVGPDGPGSKILGQPCASGAECDSTLCVDRVCCASACGTLCQACNLPGKEGMCMPIPSGMAPAATAVQKCVAQDVSGCSFDGTCDGNGGCRKYPAGAQCKAPSCNGASFAPASACDGQGACVAPKAVDCTPYKCSTASGVPVCLTTCATGGTDCVSPAACMNNSCGTRPKQPNGAGCVADTDCISVHCADGVCCAGACAGACTSCNQVGMEGMCLPVGAGKTDPHKVCTDAGASSCGKNGLCDGAGACALYPATTMCLAASCINNNAKSAVHPARHCDGKGACVTATDVDCTPYRCDTTTTACFTSCTSAALQCAAHHPCANNMCQ